MLKIKLKMLKMLVLTVLPTVPSVKPLENVKSVFLDLNYKKMELVVPPPLPFVKLVIVKLASPET